MAQKNERPKRLYSPQQLRARRIVGSLYDPYEAGDQLQSQMIRALNRNFESPITSRSGSLRFEKVGDLWAEEMKNPYDYDAIAQRIGKKGAAGTYGSKIQGRFRVVQTDAKGKERVLDETDMTLLNVPTPLFDRSYMVDGRKRYLPVAQFRRKPGVFTFRDSNDNVKTEFNLDYFTSSRVPGFSFKLQKKDGNPVLNVAFGARDTSINAWDIATALGATEKDLAKEVGADTAKAIISSSTPESYERSIRAFYDRVKDPSSPVTGKDVDLDEALSLVREEFAKSRIDPGVAKATLGQPLEGAGPKAFTLGIANAIKVARKEREEDNRDSLVFKSAMSPYDLMAEAVGHEKEVRETQTSLTGKLTRMERVLDTNPDTPVRVKRLLGTNLNKKLTTRLTSSQLQKGDSGTNPLYGWAQSTITTIMGEGGIQSTHSLTDSAKALDGSQLGVIDPNHTPESAYAGVNVHVTANTRVRYNEGSETAHSPGNSTLVTTMYDPKGKEIETGPDDRRGKIIGSFSSFTKEDGKIVPKDKYVTAFKDGEPVKVTIDKVDMWMPGSLTMMDVHTNLIPFGNSTQGNRAQYSAKQMDQTLPLKDPEAPLVQVRARGAQESLEDILGVEAGAKFSPIKGTVKAITRGKSPYDQKIIITPDDGGEDYVMPLPRNFPTAGGTPLSSRIRVRPGDKIEEGTLLSDSTFTDKGVLALGKNLRTAYMPWYTDTFEDSLVISERAAKKMTSVHMYPMGSESERLNVGVGAYSRAGGSPLSETDREHLDEHGVIKVGTVVQPGQALQIGANEVDLRRESDRTLQKLKLLKGESTSSKGSAPFLRTWRSEYPGRVVDVKKVKDSSGKVIGANYIISTEEPMRAGDKIYGRHGNKGVVSRVIPQDQMPRIEGKVDIVNPGNTGLKPGATITEEEAAKYAAEDPTFEGEPATLDLILNPLGVPSRINPSQNLETFLAKVARRNGNSEVIENFAHESNYDYVKNRLDEAGVSDTDTIIDPVTGRKIPNVGVGYQYIAKAKQTATDKTTARGLGDFHADTGAAIKGEDGAQLAGELGTYGLISQNAREVIRDMQLNKTEFRPEVIRALAEGTPIPIARDTPEAYKRFNNYLIAAGARPTEIDKGVFQLRPMTDDDIIKMTSTVGPDGKPTSSVIPKPYETIRAKHDDFDKATIAGGLFSEDVVGGANAKRWSRFELSSSIPNPAYERSILDLLGLKRGEFRDILAGNKAIELEREGEEPEKIQGAAGIQRLLQDLDLDERFNELKEQATDTKDQRLRSNAYRGMRMIKMLQERGTRPEDAFMKKQVAVLPLNMRGLRRDPQGAVVIDDVNYLYRDLGLINQGLEEAKSAQLPQEAISQIESGLYDGMAALLQTEGSKPVGGEYQGIFGTLSGVRWQGQQEVGDPKASYFRNKVLNRRQAFSARAVLAPDDKLEMDEVGLPRNVAASLFESEMKRINSRRVGDDRKAKEKFSEDLKAYIDEGTVSPEVDKILEMAIKDKYVVVKRDPVLHQYGIQGFKPVLLDEEKKSMSLNPLVYSGLNADNDGDTLAISLPLSKAAQEEVRDKLLPSQNLFSPSSGQLNFTLSQEAISGITRMTRKPMDKTDHKFKNLEEAKKSWAGNEIDIDSGVTINGKFTTLGRAVFESTLPSGVTLDTFEKNNVLNGFPDHGMGKREINGVLSYIARTDPKVFPKIADSMRREGQKYASYSSISVTMDDLRPALVEERKKASEFINKELQAIQNDKSLSEHEKDRKIKDMYGQVMTDLESKAKAQWLDTLNNKRPNSIAEMVNSGARGNMGQLAQTLLAPIAVLDSQDKILRNPVMKGYVEGLSPEGYWAAAYGARKGAVNKVVQVQQPGALSKEIINTAIDTVITEKDCGTDEGIDLKIGKGNTDQQLLGRTLVSDVSVGDSKYKSGRTLGYDDLRSIDGSVKGEHTVQVRSPLTCKAKKGVCQKCAGAKPTGEFPEIGTNIGVQAAQALGERSTQLMLSSFHSGGRYDPKGGTAGNLFDRAQAVLRMPNNMGGMQATIARADATIEDISEDRDTGMTRIRTSDSHEYNVPTRRYAPDGKTPIHKFYKPGDTLKRGQVLTDGIAHPAELYETTGDLRRTRNYMVDELDKVFGPHGISRRNSEVVVRSMTNAMEVTNAGKSTYMPGQRISDTEAWSVQQKNPDVKFTPVLKGVNVAPRELREDYMSELNFNHLRKSISNSFAKGATTDIHGTNPIPGMGFGKDFNRPPQTKTPGTY